MRCFVLLLSCIFILLNCGRNYEQIGVFSVKYGKGYKEITDGIGRAFILVSDNKKDTSEYRKDRIIKIPVKKVIVYSTYNAALIKQLGHVNSIVGVVVQKKYWYIPEIKKGLEQGKITYLGQYNAIDYEKLRSLKPDLVLTWDEGIVPKLEELGIPCVITCTRFAPDLKDRIKFILFLSVFYNEEKKAKSFIKDQFHQIKQISHRLKNIKFKPKVIWGDIYPRKVLVEPGNSWAAQSVEKAGGDYLFNDLEGASCMQITVEKFFARAKNADILITYRGPEVGITSKKAFRQSTELLKVVDIKPLNKGKIYFTGWRIWESADTAGVIYELASIFHPKLFPIQEHRYFFELK